jgi:UDP-2,3-diacylglucosamine pyrophosphatase LpxH
MSERLWSIDTDARAVPTLRADVKSDQQLNVLYLGDLHWDHAQCDRAGLRSVLDQAVERDAVIVLLGDNLCLMQGRDDRRSGKDALRPEHKTDAYFSTVVDDFAEWYAPYADRTWFTLEGNHESAVRKHHEIDITRMWVSRLNAAGATIQYPGYASYARVLVNYYSRRGSVRFFAHHGHGGGGEVTRGTIQAQRRAVLYPDANWIISGHVHSSYQVDHEQFRMNDAGKPFVAVQTHLSVGSWKPEFGDGTGGWHVEKGRGPRQASGWWCRVSASSARGIRYAFEKAEA